VKDILPILFAAAQLLSLHYLMRKFLCARQRKFLRKKKSLKEKLFLTFSKSLLDGNLMGNLHAFTLSLCAARIFPQIGTS
jgi:hypothetical protein